MPSKRTEHQGAYVWIWLPKATEPVVAGQLVPEGDTLLFHYGQSYLGRKDAISLYTPELPLQAGGLPLLPGLSIPGCIRDGAPDAWGRRVLLNKVLGVKSKDADVGEL
ncbi:MAG: type II toxin-antitoxin system HipA family toxin, partial [Gammaproteobacteria bacterium]|nr:type II toxin-antitoxin system HipA family toxin [Gammaproteobacteria bacterium]